jgi:hypothetical protein
MSSSEESAGWIVLNRWKAIPTEIQVSFADAMGRIGFRMEGTVSFSNSRLVVEGNKGECFLDLTDLSEDDFKDVVTNEELEGAGLSTESYSESVTVTLVPLGDCVLTALPPLRPSSQPN